jgi:hypothetical protein
MRKAIIAIETFELCETNNPDLLLTGHSNICNANNDYMLMCKASDLSDDSLIKNFIGLGEENTFNYIIESFIDKKQTIFETGIGYAYEINNKCYFKKICAITHGTNYNDATLCIKQPHYQYDPKSVNIIRSYIPDKYFQTLHFDNSLLISTAPYTPSCLHIKKNSIAGRFDGDITSISLTSKEFASFVINAIREYTNQLTLKSSKLDAKFISTGSLQLKPSNINNAKKGTLVYDETTDSVKFYNGTNWRILKWEEKENQE